MSVREASCACGKLTAHVEGEPVRVSVCQCLDCKRRTGSAFAWNAVFPAEQVRIEGDFTTFERGSEDGFWARHHFCPACGSTVFYEIERRPGMISIPVGVFSDPDFPAPTVEVYGERRPAWLPELAPTQE
ncbi:GFA family protein [Sphingosinicella terrae]|jgi:hypothetical protein|uniref:GFA family protein n=1 Tax=Sphingosinicella terrae TaxID=2172047 RepID=UPI000E0D6BD5|nr:GFA family protein [Sphingosinicella terrae]